MAIFSLNAKVFSRSMGHSSIAAAAYRRGIMLVDERLQQKHDYSNRETGIYSELSMPENAPSWINELQELYERNPIEAIGKLWNTSESFEKRKDSALAREIRIALPIELTAGQNIELTRQYVESQLTSKGMIADWSIHFDMGNPHAHIMLTTRTLTEKGFGEKVTEWKDKSHLIKIREAWAKQANQFLARHGIDAVIDHRSYEEQGIKLIPTKHLGKSVMSQESRGIKTRKMAEQRLIQKENLHRISENPNILTESIVREASHFTHDKVVQSLARQINPHDGETSILPQVLLERQNDISKNINDYSDVIVSSISPDTFDEPKAQPLKIDFFNKMLEMIEKHESVFSERDVAQAISQLVPDAELFAQTLIQVKAELKNSDNIMSLGVGDDGRERFTTCQMFNLENAIQDLTDDLNRTQHSILSEKFIERTLNVQEKKTGKTLLQEQKDALLHLLKPTALSCLVGRAGTGKSFTMGMVREVYEKAGYSVQGVALSGIASDGLTRDAGISSKTIKAFENALNSGFIQLSKRDVLVMDESGMTDSHSMLVVLQAVKKSGAKLILIGDPEQLQPVGPGAVFRAILERIGHVKLEHVYRQMVSWQKEATINFANGNVLDAIDAYRKEGCIHLEKTEQDTINHLVRDWQACFIERQNIAEQIVITYRNTDVHLLNSKLRQHLVDSGYLSEGYVVSTKDKDIRIAKNDRILFLKNDYKLGVSNGRFASITHVNFTESGKVINFKVRLDGMDNDILINPKEYKDFDHGYAATIHKTQGITKDHSFVYAMGKGWNRALAYVAMTRHRFTANLYAAETSFPTFEILARALSNFSVKDSVLNFPLAFAQRRGIEPNISAIAAHLAKQLRRLKEDLSQRYQQWRDPKEYQKAQNETAIRESALNERLQKRQDAVVVAEYADQCRESMRLWALIKEDLKESGIINVQSPAFEHAKRASIHYLPMMKVIEKRDRLANVIYPQAKHHERAIQLNRLNLTELAKHAAAHEMREKLQSYQMVLKSHSSLLIAQKMAYELSSTIKTSYPLMKTMNIDVTRLSSDAKIFHQRLYKKSLSPDERKAFDRVAVYQTLLAQSGGMLSKLRDLYHAEKYPEACNVLQEKLITLSQQKSNVAAQILKDREVCAKGLDYFEIGKGINIARAQKRWIQLQQAASFHQFHQETPVNLLNKKSSIAATSLESKSNFIDLVRLKSDLNNQAEKIALHYLGQPKKQARGQYRYGDKQGSLFVTLTGNKQGSWYDFQTAEGGDMLSLISHTTGKNFKESLKEAVEFLGGKTPYLLNHTNNFVDLAAYQKRQEDKAHKERVELEKKVAHVQSIASGTFPIKGTLAEKYLREHRAIHMELNSDNVRYHPALENWITKTTHPALVILAHDEHKQLVGVQATFLDPVTANKAKLPIKNANKLSRGSISQGSVIHRAIGNNPHPTIALAEGAETALSVAEAHPDWEVRVTFGVSNFTRSIMAAVKEHAYIKENAQPVIICKDNDGLDSGTNKAIDRTVKDVSENGVVTHVVEPSKPSDQEKWDFNNTHKTYGISAVKRDLDASAHIYEKEEGKTSLIQSLSPEQEEKFKVILKDYKKLRAISEKTHASEDEVALRQFSHKLWTKGKNLMKYTQEKYPNIYQSIEGFSKEYEAITHVSVDKETEYKEALKHYKHLREVYDKDPYKLSMNHENLAKFADGLVKNKALIQYAHAKYPEIAKNLEILSRRARGQEQDRSIDR